MTIFVQPHSRHNDPAPPVEESGDNYIAGLDEPRDEAEPSKEEAPTRQGAEHVEEQHDAGHGDLHPSNEVWR